MGECKISSVWLIVIPTLSIRRRSFIPLPAPLQIRLSVGFFFFFLKIEIFWINTVILGRLSHTGIHCFQSTLLQLYSCPTSTIWDSRIWNTTRHLFFSNEYLAMVCGLWTLDKGLRVRYNRPLWNIIYNTCHLCTCSRIDGIKATCVSHGISVGKLVIKFSNTSNRGQVYLFCQNKMTIS